ncbi:MAG: hypothetical protein HQL31_00225 [Planctomycetes bacterium]|nr:hypothetical protein [Planctomycetota bacterium]
MPETSKVGAVLLIIALLTAELSAQIFFIPENHPQWVRVQEIQSEHVPEAGLRYRYSLNDSETGQAMDLSLRLHTKTYLSVLYHLSARSFTSRTGLNADQQLPSAGITFFYDKKQLASTRLSLETGHQNRIGAGFYHERRLRDNFQLGLGFSSTSEKDGLLSLLYDEQHYSTKLSASWYLPGSFYLYGESGFEWLSLKGPGNPWGHEWSGSLTLGADLLSRRRNSIGWQFFDSSFTYPDPLYSRLLAFLSQSFTHFTASPDYVALIDRTRRSAATSTGLQLDLPLSRKLGYYARLGMGQDLERKIRFGKIRELSMGLRLIPRHQFQVSLAIENRTETAGNIAGENSLAILSIQVNL